MRVPETVKRVALCLLAFVLGTCMACVKKAPVLKPLPPVRVGIVRPWALMVLMADWDASDTAHERGYCVTVAVRVPYPKPDIADSVYIVWGVTPALEHGSGEDWINYRCAPGQPSVHTHPTHGGVPNCDPSKPDRLTLRRERAPFAVVQCDRGTFRFYYPTTDD